LTEFGRQITPNFHSLAREFVDLDNFFDSGDVSGDGWPWSTAGRESDFGKRSVPRKHRRQILRNTGVIIANSWPAFFVKSAPAGPEILL